jgi:pimeloyl-ACP methyl ester carboxylesterase
VDHDDVVPLPDGRRAQCWQGGSADGPAVIFLPGCPDSRLAALSGAAAACRLGVRLVAVNRPGYGLSDPIGYAAPAADSPGHRVVAEDLGHRLVADDVAAVADRLGIDRFAILGMSLGGPYALACAAAYPDRVRAVGAVASPAPPTRLDPPGHRDDLSARQRELFARLADSTPADAIALLRPDFEAYVAELAPQDPDDEALARRLTAQVHPLDAEVLASQPAAEVAAAAREALVRGDGYLRDAAVTFRAWDFDPAQVAGPTWLWYGRLDSNVSLRNADWLHRRIPSSTLVIREDTAHLGTLVRYWDDILAALAGAGRIL